MKPKKLDDIRSTGFKVPKDYFDNLEHHLMQNIDDNKKAPVVAETGFKVPKGYFETVDKQVLERLRNDNTPVIKLSLKRKLIYFTGVAAAVIIALSIFLKPGEATTLSTEMVETYFKNSDLNSYELAELLTEAEFLEDNFNLVEPNYSEDNLESYLLENVDLETIIE